MCELFPAGESSWKVLLSPGEQPAVCMAPAHHLFLKWLPIPHNRPRGLERWPGGRLGQECRQSALLLLAETYLCSQWPHLPGAQLWSPSGRGWGQGWGVCCLEPVCPEAPGPHPTLGLQSCSWSLVALGGSEPHWSPERCTGGVAVAGPPSSHWVNAAQGAPNLLQCR